MFSLSKPNIFLFFCFSIFSIKAKSQNFTKVNSLHLFFQKNTDTTIILNHQSIGSFQQSHYKIISKKADTITRYIYELTYNELPKMPKVFKDTLTKFQTEFKFKDAFKGFYNIGINRHFKALHTREKIIVNFWQDLMKLQPWNIKDDKEIGNGCPNDQNKIYDGTQINLFLITRNEIKILKFNNTQSYEKICPEIKDRSSIIAINKLFTDFYK